MGEGEGDPEGGFEVYALGVELALPTPPPPLEREDVVGGGERVAEGDGSVGERVGLVGVGGCVGREGCVAPEEGVGGEEGVGEAVAVAAPTTAGEAVGMPGVALAWRAGEGEPF